MRATIFFLLTLLCTPLSLAAQETTGAAAVITQEQVESAVLDVSQAGPDPDAAAVSGLPVRSAQARTMRAYWHVFIAFALTWALLFGYALTIGRRFGKLELEVRRLREEG